MKLDVADADMLEPEDIYDRADLLKTKQKDRGLSEEEVKEWKELISVVDAIHPDSPLIHDDYFYEHALQFAEDHLDTNLNVWPLEFVDWDKAVEALKDDLYERVEIGDDVFWQAHG